MASTNELLAVATKGDGSLWAGTGNPATEFILAGGSELQLALAARETKNAVTYNAGLGASSWWYQAPHAGEGIRFLYSVASEIYDLKQFAINLKIDLDPSYGERFKSFILTDTGSLDKGGATAHGYTWVWDKDGNGIIDNVEFQAISDKEIGSFISDDQGNLTKTGQVTQNIENIAWFDDNLNSNFLVNGYYSVSLTAKSQNGQNHDVDISNQIILIVGDGPLQAVTTPSAGLLAVAQNLDNLWAGTGNPAAGFLIKEAEYAPSGKLLQLGLTARQTKVGEAYETVPGKSNNFAIDNAGDDIRFAYSIATDAASLANFDIKMKMDMDEGLGAKFKTFILTEAVSDAGSNPSGFAWVLDADNDGKISTTELAALTNKTAGAYIADDQGNGSQVSQNIMNLGWFDADMSTANVQKGTYDIILEAYDKGNGLTALGLSPVISNKIVLEVAGGAPPVVNPPVTPPVTPPVEPPVAPPEPYVPPVVSDPSPDDGFNEAQPGVAVMTFLTGSAPTAEKQADLAAFVQLQYDAYAAKGVSDPVVGAYEALGRSFAETAEFAAKYGAQSEENFITGAYLEVFGRAPSPLQQAHFQAQIDYFEAIYKAAGISDAQAGIFSKGAILGQMLGHAASEPVSQSMPLVGISAMDSGWDFAA